MKTIQNLYKVTLLFLLVGLGLVKGNSSVIAHRDSMPVPQLVKSDVDGSFTLHALQGKAIGPNIKYMPEWLAYGWFTSKDRVEWEVDVIRPAVYEVFLEWSVSDESSRNTFHLICESDELTGQVRRSGSWYTYRIESIGEVRLEKGQQKVVFQSANDDVKDALLDLRSLRFLPIIPYTE